MPFEEFSTSFGFHLVSPIVMSWRVNTTVMLIFEHIKVMRKVPFAGTRKTKDLGKFGERGGDVWVSITKFHSVIFKTQKSSISAQNLGDLRSICK